MNSDTRNDDELLSRFRDGELTPEEAEHARARLAREPELAARLEAFEDADAALRHAYTSIADEPLPITVVEQLGADRPRQDDVVPLRRRPSPGTVMRAPLAMAAGLSLVVGTLVGLVVATVLTSSGPREFTAAAGRVPPGSELHAALESMPSTASRELATGERAEPRLTFRTGDGRYCRQLDLVGTDRTAETLACRDAGGWWIEVVAFAGTGDDAVYRPAAGTSTPVASTIETLMRGAPLGPDAERDAMASGWRPAAP